MSTIPQNTVHRVFSIPEILELIFSFLDGDSVKSSVTVCKRWSDLALNTLWREVSNPRHLFALLAPMVNPQGSPLCDWVGVQAQQMDNILDNILIVLRSLQERPVSKTGFALLRTLAVCAHFALMKGTLSQVSPKASSTRSPARAYR